MKYVQTKESFEKFLEECRMQAQNIVLPLVPHVDCPICGNPAPLKNAPIQHRVERNVYKGTSYYYHCQGCNEEFTTNDSDGLSLATFEPVEPYNTNP